jgi:hypothetical protein
VFFSALLTVALVGLPSAARGQAELGGEYGLWVTDSGGDEVGVGWLLSGSGRGFLEVFADGRSFHRAETPSGQSHFATFPRPSADTVLLRYGALGAEDLHATVLYLREDVPLESGVISGVDSLYVVGDVHGEYDRLVGLLGNAGLLDSEGEWVGGRRHVVFLGDLFDRGADVTRTMWFLYELERQARAAGGGAHLVLGNHETMIFTGDLRYVSQKEQLIANLHGTTYSGLFDIRRSVLGQWLVGRPGLMKVDGVLLAHGGVAPVGGGAPGWSPRSVETVNDSMRTFMSEDLFYNWADTTMGIFTDSATAERLADRYTSTVVIDGEDAYARRTGIFFDPGGILWFRGYVASNALRSELNRVLDEFGADIHVVAHTPMRTIQARYGGRLLAVDLERPATGMLLLVRDPAGGAHRRWRVGLSGPPEPF